MLIIDGVKYKLWIPKDEKQLEVMVKEHFNDIFGENSLYFDINPELRSKAGIGSKPDGLVVVFDKPCFYVVEIERAEHGVHDHVVTQISKFNTALKKSPETRMKIANAIYDEILSDPFKQFFAKLKVKDDLYKFLTDLVSSKPIIVIIIDEVMDELKDAIDELPLESKIVEFRTFVRVDAESVHAHLFEPLYEEVEEVSHARYDKERKGFFCLMGDEKHNSILVENAVEIVKHLRDEHHIDPDNQIIEGWTRQFDRQWKEYEGKVKGARYPPHRLSWEKRLAWVNTEIQVLVSQLIIRVEKEIPDAEHLPKYRWYYFYKGKSRDMDSLFTVLMLTKKAIKVRIKTDPKKFKDTRNWTKVYKGWFFKKGEEREFKISDKEQINYAMELIKQSYEISG